MKQLIIGSIAAIGLAAVAQAAPYTAAESRNVEVTANLESVDHIPALGRLHSWSAVDQDTLIIWATASRPYLINISRPMYDLRFVNAIGVSEFAGRVHSRFDSIYIDGFPHRIAEIYKLSREDAKAL